MIISPNISFEIDDTGAREYDSMEDERPNEKGEGTYKRWDIFILRMLYERKDTESFGKIKMIGAG